MRLLMYIDIPDDLRIVKAILNHYESFGGSTSRFKPSEAILNTFRMIHEEAMVNVLKVRRYDLLCELSFETESTGQVDLHIDNILNPKHS